MALGGRSVGVHDSYSGEHRMSQTFHGDRRVNLVHVIFIHFCLVFELDGHLCFYSSNWKSIYVFEQF